MDNALNLRVIRVQGNHEVQKACHDARGSRRRKADGERGRPEHPGADFSRILGRCVVHDPVRRVAHPGRVVDRGLVPSQLRDRPLLE